MHFATCKSFDGKQDHYVCSSYKSGRGTCSAHYIREDVLRELVLERHPCGLIPISGRTWRGFRKNGCNAAAPIRNATSVKIGSEWSRPRNGWLTWMFFCPDFMRDFVLGDLSKERYKKMTADYGAEQERLKLAN